jgi:hypothetical protein
MAKTKVGAGKSSKPASKSTGGARVTILSLKGTSEWSEWLGELATRFRTTKAGIIDRALMELAERDGFKSPPGR